MKMFWMCVCIMLSIFASSAFCVDAAAPTEEIPVVVVSEEKTVVTISIVDQIMAGLQTNAGITFILAIWSFIMAKLFTKKPKWRLYYEKYKGSLIEAVRLAEKAGPDDAENKAALRADAAMKLILKVVQQDEKNPDVVALHDALNVTHNEL